jgi:hypothetical protein
MQQFVKDPNATLDYLVNWVTWLGSDTILTSTWIVPSGVTKVSDSHSATAATIWLSGGTVGNDYELTNRIVTAAGRTEDRTITIQLREK